MNLIILSYNPTVDRLIDWLIDWSFHFLIDWLIDWFSDLQTKWAEKCGCNFFSSILKIEFHIRTTHFSILGYRLKFSISWAVAIVFDRAHRQYYIGAADASRPHDFCGRTVAALHDWFCHLTLIVWCCVYQEKTGLTRHTATLTGSRWGTLLSPSQQPRIFSFHFISVGVFFLRSPLFSLPIYPNTNVLLLPVFFFSSYSFDTETSPARTASTRKESSTSGTGTGSAMIVHGFHHAFELEVDVEAPLRTVIRLIQPSLNFDLSKATITLRGEHEVSSRQT